MDCHKDSWRRLDDLTIGSGIATCQTIPPVTEDIPDGIQSRIEVGQSYDIDMSADGAYLAVGTDAGIVLYDAQMLEELWFVPLGQGLRGWSHVAISPDCTAVAAIDGSRDSHVNDGIAILDLRSGDLIQSIESLSPRAIRDLAWSTDGSMIAAADHVGAVYVWDSRTAEMVQQFPSLAKDAPAELPDDWWPDELTWSPDDEVLAVSYSQVPGPRRTVTVFYDVRNGRQVTKLTIRRGLAFVEEMAFSPNGEMLAVLSGHAVEGAGILHDLLVYDLQTGTRLYEGDTRRIGGSMLLWSYDSSEIVVDAGPGLSALDVRSMQWRVIVSNEQLYYWDIAWVYGSPHAIVASEESITLLDASLH